MYLVSRLRRGGPSGGTNSQSLFITALIIVVAFFVNAKIQFAETLVQWP